LNRQAASDRTAISCPRTGSQPNAHAGIRDLVTGTFRKFHIFFQ
jgi:hypothetical protein